MATKSKEKLASAKSPSAEKLAKKSAEQPVPEAQAEAQASVKKEVSKAPAASTKQTCKAKPSERITQTKTRKTRKATTPAQAQELETQTLEAPAPEAQAAASPSQLVTGRGTDVKASSIEASSRSKSSSDGITFLAADCVTDNIWIPNTAIPSIDQATYESHKTKAEGQRRAIEVASLNLKNINDLNQLEGQSIEATISAKTNETRTAQLAGADIEHQTQLEINGEKSQYQKQAAAKREAAIRQTGYTEQLLSLKDQNFELEIQQAQTVFSEKAARYRAQLTGQ